MTTTKPGQDDGGTEIAKLAARMLGLVQTIEIRDAPPDSVAAAHMAMLAGYAALVGASEFIAPTFSAEERERVREVTPEIVSLLRGMLGRFQKNRGNA